VEATLWRFVARPGKEQEFEDLYGPGGLWAALFHESRAYHGTILLRDATRPRAYTLLDFWGAREDFEALKKARAEAYAALDQAGEALTESEEHLGWFDDVP
jgi:hypothetical protein